MLEKLVIYTDSDNNIVVEIHDPKKTYPDNVCQFDEMLSFTITDLNVNKLDLITYIIKT